MLFRSGTAAWTFVNISQYILGVYPTHNGLSINPCVPADFGDFSLTRKYRGATYNISVKQNGAQKGIQKLVVNGKEIEGNIIPYDESVKEYTVEAIMG